MNIFVVDTNPFYAAKSLPEKYLTKMPLETCQMISIIYSPWYHDWGTIPKKDGTPYKTNKGAFRNHPCTKWAASSYDNLSWLILHGIYLCEEYSFVYSSQHACQHTLKVAYDIFVDKVKHKPEDLLSNVKSFARAMPDNLKHNKLISDTQAYREYLKTKPWIVNNYSRNPSRKPFWI